MGNDGLRGAREVQRRGGRILVEAEETCTVYGMPRAIVEAAWPTSVLDLGACPRRSPARPWRERARFPTAQPRLPAQTPRARRRRGRTSFGSRRGRRLRRLLRRPAPDLRHRPAASTSGRRWSAGCARSWPAGISMLTDASTLLRRDATELDALLDRVTINVSQLWRHPEQWTRLERDVLAELAAAGPVRAWSAGCSYGAEAYTLAAVCRRARSPAPGRDPRHRHRQAHGRARQRPACSPTRTPAASPSAAMERGFERTPTGWRAKPVLRAMTTLRGRRPAASCGRRAVEL